MVILEGTPKHLYTLQYVETTDATTMSEVSFTVKHSTSCRTCGYMMGIDHKQFVNFKTYDTLHLIQQEMDGDMPFSPMAEL